MLRNRVMTAAVLAPLFVLGVLKLPGLWFALLVGLVVLVAAWEWTRLSGYTGTTPAVAAVAVACVLMAAVFHFRDAVAEFLFILACGAWVLVTLELCRHRGRGPLDWPAPVRWSSGIWVLVPAWLALTVLQHTEPAAAMMLFLLVWAADIGAYFSGKRWGRRSLAPAISPGKTLEGVAGGLVSAALVAAGFAAWWRLDPGTATGLVVVSLGVVTVSIFGDLFESNWKRLASLKDSGSLLPGHGGVLDRIDSMTAAAPFFVLGWLWWFDSTPA
jgi:phosphatidate cytidylyltransferase